MNPAKKRFSPNRVASKNNFLSPIQTLSRCRVSFLCAVVVIFFSGILAAQAEWWVIVHGTQAQKYLGSRRGPFATRAQAQAFISQSHVASGTLSLEGSDATPSDSTANFNKEIEDYSTLVHRITQGMYGTNYAKNFNKYYVVRGIPAGSGDLSERLDRLQEGLANFRRSSFNELQDAIHERDHSQTISGEIEKMDKETAAIQHDNKVMDNDVYVTEEKTQLVTRHTLADERNALRWFQYITPKDSLSEAVVHYLDTVGTGLVPKTAIPSLKTYVAPPPEAVTISDIDYDVLAMHGSNIQKIKQLNDSYDDFLSLEGKIKEVEREYDRNWLGKKQDELYRLKHLQDKGVFEGKQLAKQLKVAHDNFVVGVVENFVWKTYVTHISIEETKKFYALNKSWYQLGKASQISDDEVKRKVEEGKSALDILGSRAEGMKDFLDVQKRTLDLIANVERFLLEAPAIAALATPEETQSFLRAVDKEQGDFSIEVIKAWHGRYAPSSPMAQALKRTKVPKPFQDIAKKLGLADSFDDPE